VAKSTQKRVTRK